MGIIRTGAFTVGVFLLGRYTSDIEVHRGRRPPVRHTIEVPAGPAEQEVVERPARHAQEGPLRPIVVVPTQVPMHDGRVVLGPNQLYDPDAHQAFDVSDPKERGTGTMVPKED